MIMFNGMVLTPLSCTVTHEAVGQFEMEMVLPLDAVADAVTVGELISLPVPVQESPAIQLYHQGVPGVPGVAGSEVWRTKVGMNLYLRPKPAGEGYALKYLPAGTEYAKLRNIYTQWHEAVVADGTVGVVFSPDCEFVRNEPDDSSVVKNNRARAQLFRIYAREKDTAANTATIRGRHISYDAGGVLLNETALLQKPVPSISQVIAMMKSSVIGPSDIDIRTPRTNRFTADYRLKTLQQAIMDPDEGLIGRTRGKLVRDNLDYYVLFEYVMSDRGITIQYGKNLKGVKMTVDEGNVLTGIVPVGRDKEGKEILLPARVVNSPRSYPYQRVGRLDVQEAKVSDEMSVADVYAMLNAEVQAAFDAGADLPDIQMDIDFLALGDTEEYAQYRDLERLYLYDTVSIESAPHGISVRSKVIAYEWDVLRGRYNSLRLGDAFSLKGPGVASYQLPNGGVQGFKLVPQSVDRPQLMPGAVGTLQIEEASITIAKMQQAAVDALTANSITAIEAEFDKITAGTMTTGSLVAGIVEAVKAEFERLVTGSLTTDELYANIATIAVAQLNAVTMQQANIAWADIETLVSEISSILTAQIGTANIDWAHIKDLVTDTAILSRGVGGEFYFSKLAVTEANMVSLTTGSLVVKGSDGHFYSIGIDGEGQVTATLKTVVNDDIADVVVDENDQVIYGGITAEKLNVRQIFADTALVRELMAANIDVDTLWAREAFINQLKTADLIAMNETIRVKFAGMDAQAEEQGQYLKLGKLTDSAGNPRMGIAIGDALQVDAAGNITKASKKIFADEEITEQNGEQVFLVKQGEVTGKKAKFKEYMTGESWNTIEDANRGYAIVWAG